MKPFHLLGAVAVGFVGYQLLKKPVRFVGDKVKVGDRAIVAASSFPALPDAVMAPLREQAPFGTPYVEVLVQTVAPDSFTGLITGVGAVQGPGVPGGPGGVSTLQTQALPVAAGPLGPVPRSSVIAVVRGSKILSPT